MQRILEVHDGDFARRVAAAFGREGIPHKVAEGDDEGGLIRWCVEVAELDFPKALLIIDRESALDWEEKAPIRCPKCTHAMNRKDDGDIEPSVGEYVCGTCGAVMLVPIG